MWDFWKKIGDFWKKFFHCLFRRIPTFSKKVIIMRPFEYHFLGIWIALYPQ